MAIMDEKLKSFERMRVMLSYHRYVCYLVAGVIVAMCINGAKNHRGSLKETIAFGLLGVGCCVFSLMSGIKQKAVLEQKLAQYKAKAADASAPTGDTESEPEAKKPSLSRKARRR